MAPQAVLHRHRGTRAISRMVEFAPATGGLALWVRHEDVPAAAEADAPAPPLRTDGRTLYYGAAFERQPLKRQIGWVAHEVLHIALRHPQRLLELRRLLGDVDLRLFNICADAIVNSTLGAVSWLELPAASVSLERLLADVLGIRESVEKSLLEWDLERLYRAIDDREPTQRRGRPRPARSAADALTQPRRREDGRPASTQGPMQSRALEEGRSADPEGTTQPPALNEGRSANREGPVQPPAFKEGRSANPEGPVQPPAFKEGRSANPEGPVQPPARVDGLRAARVRTAGADSPADLMPGADTAGPPEAEAEQAREWSERILRAHAGDGAHSMLRALIADLPHTRTPWEQILRTRLAHCLASKPGISWSRPARSYIANQGRSGRRGGTARRLPWEPGVAPAKAVPRLAVIVDVSGSIDTALLARFACEIEAITRRLEAGVILVIGDDRVARVTRFEPGRCKLGDIEFRGGGGTDFTPLLEEADRHAPDIAVVLTDLQGPAHFRPSWPVIWAVPATHARAVVPFGRKLTLV